MVTQEASLAMGGIALAFMDVAIALAGIALKTLGQLNNVTHFEIGLIDLIASHITSNASFANNYNKIYLQI